MINPVTIAWNLQSFIGIPIVTNYKGIQGGFNRRSTANQPRSQWCQSWESSVVSGTILRRESAKNSYTMLYISHCIETWHEPGPIHVGWIIANQRQTNCGFYRHLFKTEFIWFVRLWTSLFWFFFAISYHYEIQFPDSRVKVWKTCHAI